VAELPGAVDLVAEAPDLHVPGLLAPVLAAQLRPVRVRRLVRVVDPVAGVLDRAEARVDAEVRLDLELLAVREEIVGPEAVGLERAPGVVAAHGPLVAGPIPSFQL
jgi:hypothetical protein